MSSKKSNELLNEVTNHIKEEFGFEVVDSFSDCGNIYTVIKENPYYREGMEFSVFPVLNYLTVCEFSVFKTISNERYTIWDYREKQPYFDDEHCVYGKFFGKYEFADRDKFYNHIISDFGLHFGETNLSEFKSFPFEEISLN